MKKIIIYSRVSTDKQGDLSFEAQERKMQAYAEIYDLEIIEMVRETASGKDIKHRPILQSCLDKLKKGIAEGLIISKLDRLTRSTADLDFLLTKYFKKKYHLFCVQESINTSSASGRFLLNIMIATSQYEREICAERVTDAMTSKIIKKQYTGGRVLFGNKIGDKGELIPNEREQNILKKIETLKKEGLSMQKIADALNFIGARTRTGAPFNRESVRTIWKTHQKNAKLRS